MFLKAQAAFNIDMQASVMVGDNISDLEAAIAAGVGHLNFFISKSIDRTIIEIELDQAKNLRVKTLTSLSDVNLTGTY
jgi:histidinol phosphatase-like enzyme